MINMLMLLVFWIWFWLGGFFNLDLFVDGRSEVFYHKKIITSNKAQNTFTIQTISSPSSQPTPRSINRNIVI